MNIQRWIARREPNWQRLDALLKQVERKGLKSLRSEEIRLLASLYRSVSADLARARTHQVGSVLVQDLQALAARGYAQIYQGSRRQEWRSVVEFYRWGFPAVVQQTWGTIAVAIAISLLAALTAWWFAWQDPAFLSLVLPERLVVMVRDKHELWMGSIVGIEPLASSGIMMNNLSVSFGAIAGGITAGVYTTFLLAINGLTIGAVGALVGQNNLAYPFWAFVLPHGSLELPAIFFAGGAGLLLARGILFPGQHRRVDALRFYGLQAAKLTYGIVPMLIIAGAVEGFFSPSPLIPDLFKYCVGMALFMLLLIYCSQKPPERHR